MDDGRLDLVQVSQCIHDLHDDRACLLLRHELVLLQVEVQVIALTVLQHRAEPVGGDRRTGVSVGLEVTRVDPL